MSFDAFQLEEALVAMRAHVGRDACYCAEDFDGAGYSYQDEYGDCYFCDTESLLEHFKRGYFK